MFSSNDIQIESNTGISWNFIQLKWLEKAAKNEKLSDSSIKGKIGRLLRKGCSNERSVNLPQNSTTIQFLVFSVSIRVISNF